MKIIRYLLIALALLVFITGCNPSNISPAESTKVTGKVVGTWETRRILANGYYSEFLKVELLFNDDGSCKQVSSFESSGNPYQVVNCSFTLDDEAVVINFDDQPPLNAKLGQDELTLAHPYGVATGSGSPQTFTRVNRTN